ncbi:MAG: hypothetical protein H0X29_00420 [Parachlamydiaceae bacterium]|nr:hypothetical protein [Parachlamydiaceae bacterium]
MSERLQQSQPNSSHWFDRNFFDSHNIDFNVGTGANLWRPAAWATVASWGNWNWPAPYYYDGEGYSYPLAASTYTYPSISTTTPSQAVSSRVITSSEADWLPLGIFALANNAIDAAQSNRIIQLAINRSGEIAGVYYNSATDAAKDITGKVDPNNQEAYWSLDNQANFPIASTGIYNLTEDQTPITVYFTDGSVQTWTLVRLQQG